MYPVEGLGVSRNDDPVRRVGVGFSVALSARPSGARYHYPISIATARPGSALNRHARLMAADDSAPGGRSARRARATGAARSIWLPGTHRRRPAKALVLLKLTDGRTAEGTPLAAAAAAVCCDRRGAGHTSSGPMTVWKQRQDDGRDRVPTRRQPRQSQRHTTADTTGRPPDRLKKQ